MQIKPFVFTPARTAALVDLILYCQNTEAHLAIKMAEQPDVFAIDAYYQAPGGQFWVAESAGHVAGCIGLKVLNGESAVLKKFFTYPEFRGQPHRLGWRLYQTLLQEARAKGLKRLVLDTPEGEHRSHQFYERQGFKRITQAQLGVEYAYPDRDSRLYALTL